MRTKEYDTVIGLRLSSNDVATLKERAKEKKLPLSSYVRYELAKALEL